MGVLARARRAYSSQTQCQTCNKFATLEWLHFFCNYLAHNIRRIESRDGSFCFLGRLHRHKAEPSGTHEDVGQHLP